MMMVRLTREQEDIGQATMVAGSYGDTGKAVDASLRRLGDQQWQRCEVNAVSYGHRDSYPFVEGLLA